MIPDDSYAYYNRALAYKKKSDVDRALADYAKAIDLNSNYTEAFLNRGLILESSGRATDARKDFERFLEISTDPNMRKLVEEKLAKLAQ